MTVCDPPASARRFRRAGNSPNPDAAEEVEGSFKLTPEKRDRRDKFRRHKHVFCPRRFLLDLRQPVDEIRVAELVDNDIDRPGPDIRRRFERAVPAHGRVDRKNDFPDAVSVLMIGPDQIGILRHRRTARRSVF